MSDCPILEDIDPKSSSETPSAAQVSGGIPNSGCPIAPSLVIRRMGSVYGGMAFVSQGQRDVSIDQAFFRSQATWGWTLLPFTAKQGFANPWDSYQCKHYNHALRPDDVYGEIGKIIYHSFLRTPPFNQSCRVPQRHVFIAPLGVGITLGRLLKDPIRLKKEVRAKWESHCASRDLGSGLRLPWRANFIHISTPSILRSSKTEPL